MQIEALLKSPPEQLYPSTNPSQVELQPMLLLDLSSQVSGDITLPSPQIGLHVELDVPVHVYPVST